LPGDCRLANLVAARLLRTEVSLGAEADEKIHSTLLKRFLPIPKSLASRLWLDNTDVAGDAAALLVPMLLYGGYGYEKL
jgi:hypothetical protein